MLPPAATLLALLVVRCPVVEGVDAPGRGSRGFERITVDAPEPPIRVSFGPWYVAWKEPASGGTATFSYFLDLQQRSLLSGVIASGGRGSFAVAGRCTEDR